MGSGEHGGQQGQPTAAGLGEAKRLAAPLVEGAPAGCLQSGRPRVPWRIARRGWTFQSYGALLYFLSAKDDETVSLKVSPGGCATSCAVQRIDQGMLAIGIKQIK